MGIDHLHSQNIIYRDVKPDNLLISSHPRIKLADFGNAHFLSCEDESVCGLEGTQCYMSPEMRMKHKYSRETDVWSLGITILHILFYDEDTFPNFDNQGPWAGQKFARAQSYTSNDLKDFVHLLFQRRKDRPTAGQLLEVCLSYSLSAHGSIHSFKRPTSQRSSRCFGNFRPKSFFCPFSRAE